MQTRPYLYSAAALVATAAILGVALRPVPPVAASPTWNSVTAAHHLDARQTWWMSWPKARRDHDTACVSCHTTLPYALARPTLRKSLGESGPSHTETEMLQYVTKRVTLWDQVEPFYNDAQSGPRKAIESRGTESVLNALILSRYDATRIAPHTTRATQPQLSEITRQAFAAMWSTQLTTGDQAGAWNWLNFHNAPWESNESQYYGATLAAIAVAQAPDDYKNTPAIQPALDHLRTYLITNYAAQPLLNRIVVLWASAGIPGLLTPTQRTALLTEITAHQQPDGGWTLTTLGDWSRHDKTPLDTRSDGYATGLTVYALHQAGIPANTISMQAATAWLLHNQSHTDGRWEAYSLNKQREPATDVGQFMNDAATSYAVMALEALNEPTRH